VKRFVIWFADEKTKIVRATSKKHALVRAKQKWPDLAPTRASGKVTPRT
jgi:hypothetical protein